MKKQQPKKDMTAKAKRIAQPYHPPLDNLTVVKTPINDLPEITKTPLDLSEGLPEKVKPLFRVNEKMVEDLNKVTPNRFSSSFLKRYNHYDENMEKQREALDIGGTRANLIKSIMLKETGMSPRRNSKGYEGFPQINKYNLDTLNRKYGKDFSMEDTYDFDKSVEIINTYLEDVKRSEHVNSDEEVLIAYNWGLGNLKKYKKGEKELPKETEDYLKLFKIIKKYSK
jgi:hypothetical protein